MASAGNRQVLLKSRPTGIPQAEHFEIVEATIPTPCPGQVLVRNHLLSVDPAMRGWVADVGNYSQPVAIGEVMRALAVGRIEASRLDGYRIGDYVMGMFGWQDYAVVDAARIERKIEPGPLPLSTALGVLGINGLAAYFGLLDAGQPRAGETVAVSTAAGSVGSCVGQIANILGCRTAGITGGAAKKALCTAQFGFAAAIDYKVDDVDAALGLACPEGIDVYFDNTSGVITDAVLRHLNVGARIVICGTASVSNWDPPPLGPRVERVLLTRRARMQGFVIFDYAARYAEALAALTPWVERGLIRYREEILDGIDQAPDAIAGLYRGDNLGKRLIRLVAAAA
ncbi:MAG: NADP-dependent oxidoreductase [Gammaproteobacteria bacterium]